MDSNRTAFWLIRAGIAAMGYDAAVGLALLIFGDAISPAWAVPSFLITFALFPAAYFAVMKPLRITAVPRANLTMIFWMLRHIPHWAKLCWAATLIAVLVLMAGMPQGRVKALDDSVALLFTALGLYFALSSTLIAWAKLREQRAQPAPHPS